MQMRQHPLPDLGHQWLRQRLASGQKMSHFTKYPGPPQGSTANHDRISPSRSQHVTSFGRTVNIAVGHHRHTQRCLDCRNRFILGVSRVTLSAGASMHSDHLHPGILCQSRQLHRIFVRFAPTRTHLERHRHIVQGAGLNHGLHDPHSQPKVLHQRRASPLMTHLFGRTPHVDVDDLCAKVDVAACGVGHHLRINSCNLNRNRPGLTGMTESPCGFG